MHAKHALRQAEIQAVCNAEKFAERLKEPKGIANYAGAL